MREVNNVSSTQLDFFPRTSMNPEPQGKFGLHTIMRVIGNGLAKVGALIVKFGGVLQRLFCEPYISGVSVTRQLPPAAAIEKKARDWNSPEAIADFNNEWKSQTNWLNLDKNGKPQYDDFGRIKRIEFNGGKHQ